MAWRCIACLGGLAFIIMALGTLTCGCAQGRAPDSPSHSTTGMADRVRTAATAYRDTRMHGTVTSPTNGVGKQVSAAASAFLRVRTHMLVRGASVASLRDLCTPASGLADYVEWWALGTRRSSYGRAIGVPPKGYASASLVVQVKRVTIDQAAGTASVLAFTQPGPGDRRLVESEDEFHLVRLVRTGNGRWLACADISNDLHANLSTFLQAGGAPHAVVAAARAEGLLAGHPVKPPAGCLSTLRDWCSAMNSRDAAALRRTFTPDTVDTLAHSNAKLAAALASESNPRDWQVVRMRTLGLQIGGVACGWVYYHFKSDEPASVVGSRGYGSFAFLERQAGERWLIFSR